jgi:hypothetical protein
LDGGFGGVGIFLENIFFGVQELGKGIGWGFEGLVGNCLKGDLADGLSLAVKVQWF